MICGVEGGDGGGRSWCGTVPRCVQRAQQLGGLGGGGGGMVATGVTVRLVSSAGVVRCRSACSGPNCRVICGVGARRCFACPPSSCGAQQVLRLFKLCWRCVFALPVFWRGRVLARFRAPVPPSQGVQRAGAARCR